MRTIRFTAVLCAAIALCSASIASRAEPIAPSERPQHWYRGNTHAHTILCGHADSEPAAVAKWYLDRDYHFLCLSEHNQFIDPSTVPLPDGRRKDFILIPGQEITGEHVHMTGLNIDKLIGHLVRGPKGKVIQTYTDFTRQAGGTPIINHPNFRWALTVSDIRPAQNCYLFELWNGTPSVNNAGDATHTSTEQMWDELLTDGMVIYGVSSDDMHQLKTLGLEKSNPGRGWVMVRAPELTPAAISQALDRGDFYASNGVVLRTIELTDTTCTIAADESATSYELAKGWVIGDAVTSSSIKPGYQVEFIGPAGKIHAREEASRATYTRDRSAAYIRARITLTRDVNGVLRQYRAWTQPIFHDHRLQKLGRETSGQPQPAAASASSKS